VTAVRTHAVLAVFVLGYAAAWFVFQLDRMPPYIPGSSRDPTYAPPEAVRGLLLVAAALVLPVSAIACALAFSSARASTQAGVRRASVALTSAKFVTTGRSWPRRFLDVHWTSSSPCAKFRTMSNEA